MRPALAMLALLMLLSGCSDEEGARTVRMTGMGEFEPAALHVPVGTTVTWTNHSDRSHTISTAARDPATKQFAQVPRAARPWRSGDVQPGAVFRRRLTVPGRYVYYCRYHARDQMIGTIVVEP